MTGRVCEKHQEYCPDGNCRWCEPFGNMDDVISKYFTRDPPVIWEITDIDWNTDELKRAREAQDKSML